MRASARTRVTFVPAKVTKTIRSGTPPFGFPAFLAVCGAKRTRDHSIAQTPFRFSRSPLRYSVAVQSHWVVDSRTAVIPAMAGIQREKKPIPDSCHREPCAARRGDPRLEIAAVATLPRNDNIRISPKNEKSPPRFPSNASSIGVTDRIQASRV